MRPAPDDERTPRAQPLRIGVLGASRTRQGLGPFLASAFEAAGARVTAVAGRDGSSGERAAQALAARLQHDVTAAADVGELARLVDLLVVAAPVDAHLAGLDAALAAGVPCLCEKPLVAAADRDAGLQRIAAFRERGLLLVENCQWPFVLPTLHALHPATALPPVRTIAMGLGPAFVGPAMIADSLSHVLSVVQALVPLPADTLPTNVRAATRAADATRNVVQFTLPGPAGAIEVSLHLQHAPEPPRPAWLALNGARIDRRIGPDYTIAFATQDGRVQNLRDPLYQLVYGLAAILPHAPRERTTTAADVVALRLRLYAAVLGALDAGR